MRKSILTIGLIIVASTTMFLAGCVVTARPATVSVSASYGGWTPYYYNGYLVYFDNIGRPYYYYGGRITYVPNSWVHYNVALAGWRSNRVAYNRWHTRYHAPRYRVQVRRQPAPRRAAPARRAQPAPRRATPARRQPPPPPPRQQRHKR